MRTDKSYMIVISHFKLYPALFPLKWLICIPNISAVRGNVVFETLHDFYRTAINKNEIITILVCMFTHGYPDAPLNSSNRQFPLLFSSFCPIAPVKIAVAYGFGYMVALDMLTGFQVGNGTGNL